VTTAVYYFDSSEALTASKVLPCREGLEAPTRYPKTTKYHHAFPKTMLFVVAKYFDMKTLTS